MVIYKSSMLYSCEVRSRWVRVSCSRQGALIQSPGVAQATQKAVCMLCMRKKPETEVHRARGHLKPNERPLALVSAQTRGNPKGEIP